MDHLKTYQRTNLNSNWTRVDLLLMLYERAINSVEACEIAYDAGADAAFQNNELTLRKTIMAIHAGLKVDENEVAFNIARLIHFVMVSFDQHQFETCKTILAEIRSGFAQIADEANELERLGVISKMPESDAFESIA